MLISLKHNFVFFSNPKCATTSIENLFGKHFEIRIDSTKYGKHLRPSEFEKWTDLLAKNHNVPLLDKICTARHPVDKLISWYTYRSRPILKKKRPNRYLGDTDFREFCKAGMKKSGSLFFYNYKRNRYLVDIVVPLEHISRLTIYFNKKFKTQENLPTSNKSKKDFRSTEYRSIANAELPNASKAFQKSVEQYNYLTQYYTGSKTKRLINIRSIFKN